MTAVEDATSLDTHDQEISTISDDLNAVYKNYKFPNNEVDASNELPIHDVKDDVSNISKHIFSKKKKLM